MLISKKWLSQFVSIPKSLTQEELALKLTMSTVEVEEVNTLGGELEGIVVGRVESVEKHPDADKLQVCTVAFGKKIPAQVVCGGSNVTEGMLCAFAPLGSKVRWHGEGELIELKKAKIRGVESYGMICASEEIGLGEMYVKKDEKEILDLTNVLRHPERPKGVEGSRGSKEISPLAFGLGRDDVVGVPLAEALKLDDVIFDIDNKSMTHRPDLWGHYGLAREVSALLNVKLKEYAPEKIKNQKSKIKNRVELIVDVKDSKLCPRYMGVVIDGIEVGASPDWMQASLRAVGLRPINNIVDITNFVMFELGQPMHAFDAEHLTSRDTRHVTRGIEIEVRKAKKGEKIEALDEKMYTLTPDMLVIADCEKPIAIAGVMGGEKTGVTEATKTIIFESANFDAVSVRRTATALGIRTDSSARFEKSPDPNNCEFALRRAVQLALELCPGARVVSNVADESSFSLDQGPIELPLDVVGKKIGVVIDTKRIVQILESLGFLVKVRVKSRLGLDHAASKKETLLVTIPTWRATKDISIAEDLVEEIARIYGYDNIPASLPKFEITPPVKNPLQDMVKTMKERMAYEHGFTEVYNYSFVSPQWLEKIGLPIEGNIELENPIAKDRPLLRRNLFPGLLENIEKNAHRFESVRLFEVGRVYRTEEKGEFAKGNSGARLPMQDTVLAIASASKNDDTPFFDVSYALTSLCKQFGIDISLSAEGEEFPPFIHPGRHAKILVGGKEVGRIAEIHPETQKSLGIPYRSALAELYLDRLPVLASSTSLYTPDHQYPSTSRDVAILVDKKTAHVDVTKEIVGVDMLVDNVELFDVFTGKNISEGKKSMAYSVTYQSDKKTLTAEEADTVHEKVVKMLQKKFGAEVRE